ncbi:unnamed protein product [[Candida] boidinii]|nr:unnamed protein product [[Candida] boidinii]
MTTRGFGPEEFEKVAEYMEKAVDIALKIKSIEQGSTGREKLIDFKKKADESEEIKALDKQVVEFVSKFPVPGEL